MSPTIKKTVLWIFRIVPALIMLQTLFFKFTAAEESVYIFSKLGIEPIGRILSGTLELIASIMLLIPSVTWLGALMGILVMIGAIFAHITILGIDVLGDGGLLFMYALIVLVCCIALLYLNRKKIIQWFPHSAAG